MTTAAKPRTNARKPASTLTAEAIASLIPMSATVATSEALAATRTIEERERDAYARGDHATAAALGELAEKLHEVETFDQKNAETLENYENAITHYCEALALIDCADVAPEKLADVIATKLSKNPPEPASASVFHAALYAISCALREPQKIRKWHFSALCDVLDEITDEDAAPKSPEDVKAAIYASFSGPKPPPPAYAGTGDEDPELPSDLGDALPV